MAKRTDVITKQIINHANAWLLNLGPPKVPKHLRFCCPPLKIKKAMCKNCTIL